MAKVSSMFLCFFLLSVLIAVPVSSSSRMLLQKPDFVSKCVKLTEILCSAVTGCAGACPPVHCPNAHIVPECCNCKVCC
ncbi:hypothetical protein MKW94_005489 [Papaver nudicaule]|uniref:Uncharacterized protein n=1 Tax=Papaver nudicaule TaxID=74823 RepID=A0AA42B3M4_PAPNU|nr:hypothetical protein [Papaver nudicaule]